MKAVKKRVADGISETYSGNSYVPGLCIVERYKKP